MKGFNHALGQCAIAFFAVPKLAKRYRATFPKSLNGAPLLMPGDNAQVQAPLARWLNERQIQSHIIGKFDDSALMKAFGKAGVGVFPAPVILADEIIEQYGVEVIGCADDVMARYYAISVERRLTHPAVVAVTKVAKHALFAKDETTR